MKKIMFTAITIATVSLVLCVMTIIRLSVCYTKEAIAVNSNNGIVTIVDSTGEEWEYEGEANKGDTITAYFFNNFTSINRYDDKIIGAKR